MGPNELGWMERAVAALAGTGLDGAEQMDTVLVVSGHIRNLAQQSAPASGVQPVTSEEQMASVIADILHQRAADYPALTEAFTSAATSPSRDQGLQFGLARILDGVDLLIKQRTR
jgi:Tetracyclin repressor-like, C-terminal domain